MDESNANKSSKALTLGGRPTPTEKIINSGLREKLSTSKQNYVRKFINTKEFSTIIHNSLCT